jgi:hypothetical protein
MTDTLDPKTPPSAEAAESPPQSQAPKSWNAAAIFLSLKPEYAALPQSALAQVNINVVNAGTTSLGMLSGLVPYREALGEMNPPLNLELIDKLHDYTVGMVES